MSAGWPIAIRTGGNTSALQQLFELPAARPRLVTRDVPKAPAAPLRRSKIWEFSQHLHCSIIGTCLSTAELRQVLKKLGIATHGRTDHELHGEAVTLAGRHDDAARQLNKALDHRHKLAVSQCSKIINETELRTFWNEAVRRGEIPGAYWATLTHPNATEAIIREAFGDVHMLSHLVGSANRADIRRLCQLEDEKAVLQAKLERQQVALHEAVVTRDRQIRALRQALTERIVATPAEGEAADGIPEECAALRGLVADLERRLAAETGRRVVMEDRLSAAQTTIITERSARVAAERERDAMRQELTVLEASLTPAGSGSHVEPESRLDGIVLLYVGGRPNQVAPMRTATERLGVTFLHHDGGVEDHVNLLPGLASRATVLLFPVDCISHEAANAVKSLCRQGNKRYIPLRSASITSLLTALRTPEMIALSDATGS